MRLSGTSVLSHGLRYSLLVIYVGTIYVVVVTGGGITYAAINPSWWLILIALLIIAGTFLPVHTWLRLHIDRLVFDWHDDPYAVMSELHQQLEHADTEMSQAIVPTIAATLATTLQLPYVAIETDLGSGPHITEWGAPLPQTERLRIPLTFRDKPIGALYTAGRRPNQALSGNDLRLLHDLARQVGITLHAARLSDDLQTSREQLVTAREEERRRIRRDLHDSLGPTLASLRMQLGAVRRILRDEPDAALTLIDDLRQDLRTATAEIRRLVYALRPPLLDEHGLIGALESLSRVAGHTTLTLDVPSTLPPLPAALEVAVYRIASEAVHNVAKHAHATHCTVRLASSETVLVLTVRDDGIGLPGDVRAGVGVASMQERAAELGGTLVIAPDADGGTTIHATFPWRPPR